MCSSVLLFFQAPLSLPCFLTVLNTSLRKHLYYAPHRKQCGTTIATISIVGKYLDAYIYRLLPKALSSLVCDEKTSLQVRFELLPVLGITSQKLDEGGLDGGPPRVLAIPPLTFLAPFLPNRERCCKSSLTSPYDD